jgi:hypothetical protein
MKDDKGEVCSTLYAEKYMYSVGLNRNYEQAVNSAWNNSEYGSIGRFFEQWLILKKGKLLTG